MIIKPQCFKNKHDAHGIEDLRVLCLKFLAFRMAIKQYGYVGHQKHTMANGCKSHMGHRSRIQRHHKPDPRNEIVSQEQSGENGQYHGHDHRNRIFDTGRNNGKDPGCIHEKIQDNEVPPPIQDHPLIGNKVIHLKGDRS